jgi:hypothetical protein
MKKVALVIIYNHQYNNNIDKLESIYKDRFSHIYHLVPFYTGEKKNVIPVYENSEYFQGYVAQGFKQFYSDEYAHYVFVADDLFINPVINERNYTHHFKLNPDSSFIPNFIPLHEIRDHWAGLIRAYYYNIQVTGIEAENQLPGYEDALKKFNRYGLTIAPLTFDDIWDKPTYTPSSILKMVNKLLFFRRRLKSKLSGTLYNLSYPLVGSYSDIFIVSANTIKLFSHLCGVTAATRLFVEIGVPTSLVLSAEDIVTESDLKLKGMTLWKKEDYKPLEKYQNRVSELINNFPEDVLYIHPVKLSKWQP